MRGARRPGRGAVQKPERIGQVQAPVKPVVAPGELFVLVVDAPGVQVTIMTFGFKYGLPADADRWFKSFRLVRSSSRH